MTVFDQTASADEHDTPVVSVEVNGDDIDQSIPIAHAVAMPLQEQPDPEIGDANVPIVHVILDGDYTFQNQDGRVIIPAESAPIDGLDSRTPSTEPIPSQQYSSRTREGSVRSQRIAFVICLVLFLFFVALAGSASMHHSTNSATNTPKSPIKTPVGTTCLKVFKDYLMCRNGSQNACAVIVSNLTISCTDFCVDHGGRQCLSARTSLTPVDPCSDTRVVPCSFDIATTEEPVICSCSTVTPEG